MTTLCPTVSLTDAGELATVAAGLGIAHPTGYPLFTLLGRLVVMSPVPAEEIVKLNILASVITAVSAGIFFWLLITLYESELVFPPKRRPVCSQARRNFLASISSLVFSFSSTVWSQATSIEVYSLHVALILMTSCLYIKGLQQMKKGEAVTSQYFFLFAFTLGLSFTNHMTTILLAPAFVYLYFVTFGIRLRSLVRLVKALPFFFLGLSVYLYVPIRSSARPLLDWGHPATFERFLWHISGRQYQVWMFEGWEVAKKQLAYFVDRLPQEFHWLILFVVFFGAVAMVANSRRLVIFVLLEFLTCLVYAVNYEIHDIDSYFLLAYVVLSCSAFFGMVHALEKWHAKKTMSAGILGIFLLLPVIQVWKNTSRVDESENYLGEDAVRIIFDNVEPNSVVFTSLWDYFVSPSYYYQTVKGVRTDVAVIDKQLLQNRSWYFLQLERNHPWLLERSKERVNSFLAELDKFEHGEPFNFNVIQAKWLALLGDLVEKSLVDHNVYLDGRVEAEFVGSYEKVPHGLLFRVKKVGDSTQLSRPIVRMRNISVISPVSDDFKRYCAYMLSQNARWWRLSDRKFSLSLLEMALNLEPQYGPALALKASLLRESEVR